MSHTPKITTGSFPSKTPVNASAPAAPSAAPPPALTPPQPPATARAEPTAEDCVLVGFLLLQDDPKRFRELLKAGEELAAFARLLKLP